MPLYRQIVLLFSLNFFDAVLTIYWVRNGIATEGNRLMANLLDVGDFPFLAVKVAIGAVAAIVLWRWQTLRLARYGLAVALVLYVSLMGIHLFTGLFAVGLIPENFVWEIGVWSYKFFALIT